MSDPQPPLNFDTALTALLACCSATPGIEAAGRRVVVRGLNGQLRLVLGAPAADEKALRKLGAALSASLGAALGPWFAGPVLTTADPGAAGGVARAVLEKGKAWPDLGWPQALPAADPLAGGDTLIDTARWGGVDAHRAIGAWLSADALAPPWPLRDQTPPIVAFYSFKGGVGRSSALLATALRAARRGARVLVVDLDLEAPGLAPLLLRPEDPPPAASVLDHQLSTAATGAAPEAPPVVQLNAPELTKAGQLWLAPAGTVDGGYLQRLARLDAVSRLPGEASPLERALRDLLRQLKKAVDPQLVLLDCRTGLSDVAGVALMGLSHVEVLVGRPGRPDIDGLTLVAEALLRRPDRRWCTVVSMVQDLESPAGQFTVERHREQLWERFRDLPGGAGFALHDAGAPHHAVALPWDRNLAGAEWAGAWPAYLWEDTGPYAEMDKRLAELIAAVRQA
jgi:MinD-like ATPase involved in chromosome partitioning or flagellar assembly